MTITTIDIHVLQTVPPSNINRDDTGSPKTAIYGGVQRARVSSQAWKKAVRADFSTSLEQSEIGFRSRRWAEKLAARIGELGAVEEVRAQQLAIQVLVALKTMKEQKTARIGKDGEAAALPETDALLFLSAGQLDSLADFAVSYEQGGAGGALDARKLRELVSVDHSVDIALFGRMLADNAELNVDASVQVAHAISVHAVENEADYYTAVDDVETPDNRGAAMIGVVEFNSSTLYRFATVNVRGLARNLGSQAAAAAAAGAFVRSFITSMPTGKQNSFANRTLPSAVVVSLREGSSINFVGAFEDPVRPRDGASRVAVAAERLAAYASAVETAYGTSAVETKVLQIGSETGALLELGESATLDQIIAAVESATSAE